MDWTHVAIVYRNKTPSLYINGEWKKTGLTSDMCTVFASGVFGELDPFGSFIGQLADLRIWDHARTEAQIKDHMNRELKGDEPGLYGYWKFNEGQGVVAKDSAGNNHGTINEAKWGTVKGPLIPRDETIVVINTASIYNAVRTFGFEMAKAFSDLGYHVEVIDLNQPSAYAQLDKILNDPNISFLFGMNGHPIEYLYQKVYNNQLKIPFFAYLVDQPMYHLHRFDFDRNSKNLIISCLDQTHIAYLTTYFKGRYSKAFVPHGSSFNTVEGDQIKCMEDREIDILFAGTYLDPEKYRKKWISDFKYGRLIDEIAECAVYQYKESLLDIAENVFYDKGIEFNYSNDQVLKDLLIQVDYYIRGRRRKEVLEKLSKLPLHVYNDDWNYLSSGSERVRVHPPIDYFEFHRQMNNSKIVLNILPNLVFGGHDRVFTSMLAGAVSLTDRSVFLENHFTHEDNILMYNINDPDLAEKVQQYLLDTSKLQKIADNGRKVAQKEHIWLNRAKKILEFVAFHKGMS
jgi:hypothetical protein